jgi:hypothetical protein
MSLAMRAEPTGEPLSTRRDDRPPTTVMVVSPMTVVTRAQQPLALSSHTDESAAAAGAALRKTLASASWSRHRPQQLTGPELKVPELGLYPGAYHHPQVRNWIPPRQGALVLDANP